MLKRDRLLLILLLLVAVVAGVFWQVRSFDFVNYDDNILVYENPYYASATAKDLPSFWRAPYEQLYIPVTYAAWGILASLASVVPLAGEAQLSQLSPVFDPSIFHSANLMFHVLSVLLVFAILRLLVKSDWAAACGALLFGLHPVQVESVAWVSELKGVLCGFFSLAALWLYLLSAFARKNVAQSTPSATLKDPKRKKKSGEEPEAEPADVASNGALLGNFELYALATVALILAFLSKPAAASVPLIALVLEVAFLKSKPKSYLPFILPWLGLLAVAVFAASAAQPPAKMLQFPFWQRPLIAGDALAFYLSKLVYPFDLIIHYSRTPAWVLAQSWVYWQWLLPVAVLALAFRQRHRRPALFAGAGIFVVALLPVLGFVPFIFQLNSTVADRYLYLPMFGPALAFAGILAVVFKQTDAEPSNNVRKSWRAQAAVFLCVIILVPCAALSFGQLATWRDGDTLFRHTIAINPRAWIAHTNLGMLLHGEGKLDEAEKHYRESLRHDPVSPEARLNLAILLERQGNIKEASAYYQDVVVMGAELVKAYHSWGILLGTQGDFEQAESVLRQGIVKDPRWAPTHVALGLLLIQTGDSAGGKAELATARRLQDEVVDSQIIYVMEKWSKGKVAASVRQSKELNFEWAQAYHNLGLSSLAKKELQPAAGFFRKAIRVRSDYPEAHNALGAALAQQGKMGEAVKEFRVAVRLKPNYADALVSLGIASVQQGKRNEAIGYLKRALKIQPQIPKAQQILNELNASAPKGSTSR